MALPGRGTGEGPGQKTGDRNSYTTLSLSPENFRGKEYWNPDGVRVPPLHCPRRIFRNLWIRNSAGSKFLGYRIPGFFYHFEAERRCSRRE